MAANPGARIVEAFIAPTSRIYRRCEIYENDGITPWRPELWDRLTEGSISGEFERDEKYAAEITLDNHDGELDHAPRKLWFDKVFKPFLGVGMPGALADPSVMIAEATGMGDDGTAAMRVALLRSGLTNVQVNTTVTTLPEVQGADLIVFAGATTITKSALMHQAYEAGKSVIAFCSGMQHTDAPHMFDSTGIAVAATDITCEPLYGAGAVSRDWSPWWAQSQAPSSYRLVPSAGTEPVARIAAIYGIASPEGGVWVQERHGARSLAVQFSDFQHFQPEPPTAGDPLVTESPASSGLFDPATVTTEEPASSGLYISDAFHDDQATGLFFTGEPVYNSNLDQSEQAFGDMMRAAWNWLDTRERRDSWEVQLGEYQADSITVSEDGDLISLSMRDYAKRALGSKLVSATTFSAGAGIRSIITAVAANAGISKMNVPPMPEVLGIDTTFEADTERWTVIKEICTAHSYEVYFDHAGFLTARKYRDPLTSPPTLTLSGGQYGNLVQIGSKTNDSRLFNHIVVRGESNERSIPPVSAEALNADAGSPVSIQRIGDRVEIIKTPLVTTYAQAEELAKSRLRVSSLQEFEITFDAIALPWIEPGDIVETMESRAGAWWPTRYLISSIQIPLDLSPMSCTGKRVTIVL